MAYTLQAQDTTEPFSDIDVEMLGNQGRYHVLDGCGLTYSGADLTVTIAAGTVVINGVVVAVASDSVTLVPDVTNPRWAWIGVDDTGGGQIDHGTAGADPAKPEQTDVDLILGAVLIPAGLTVASSATSKLDKRILAPASQFIRKSADESITNDNTLSNDSEFTFPVGIGNHLVRGSLHVDTNATPGFQAAITAPASSTLSILGLAFRGSTALTGTVQVTSGSVFVTFTTSSGSDCAVYFEGTVETTAAGSITLQWAQNTSDGNATSVEEGSFMEVRRI